MTSTLDRIFNSNFQGRTPMSSRMGDQSELAVRPQPVEQSNYPRNDYMMATSFNFDDIDTEAVSATRMQNLEGREGTEEEEEAEERATVSYNEGEEGGEEEEIPTAVFEEDEEDVEAIPENKYCFY